MNKGSKILVFVIVFIVIAIIGTVVKKESGMAVMSLAGVAIYFLYQSMFKNDKDKDENKNDNQSDITLKK